MSNTSNHGIPYAWQYGMAVVCTCVATGIGVVIASEPSTLGLTPVFVKWLGVINSIIAVLLGVLPKITKPPSDERVGMD